MERAFHGCSPVWRTTCLGSLLRSDPELQHFFSVFQHSPEARRRDTGFIFARRSWWTTVTYPSRQPFSALKAMKTCRSTRPSRRAPSAALRSFRSRRPMYISASPTSLFSAGPRFSGSTTVKSSQSWINFSYLNQDVDPSKSGGIPLFAVH